MLKRIKEDRFYIITILLIVFVFNIRLPYYVNAPGGTIDIKKRIEYSEMKEYDGTLNMLYVTEYVASLPFYLLSYVVPNWDLESIETSQLSTSESPEEINTRNKVMLENSISNAMWVAYTTAKKDISIKKSKYVVIATTLKNNFKIGDEVLELAGRTINDLEDVKEILEQMEINDQVKVKIKRNNQGKNITVEVKEVDGKKALGVMIMTNHELEIDPEIELKFKPSESGASGGLMMALSIYSAISGEDIIRGRNIAGTGTIDMEGNVGEIGGIKYKVMGAVKNKMDVILVPSANYKEALRVKKEHKYKVDLVEVKTFEDAINYLKK